MTVNLVLLAFAAQSEGPLRLVGYSAQGKASLVADIKARQAAGGKVGISVGGEGEQIDTSDTEAFVKDFVAIGNDLRFTPNGIDWDIEYDNSSSQIVEISRALRAHYGPGFSITYSAGGANNDQEAENRAQVGRELNTAGLLDAYTWQFYMADVPLDVAKWRLDWLIARGVPVGKLSIGMMVGNDSISWTNGECAVYMRDFYKSYGINKAALWANPWDSADTLWATNMREVLVS